MVERNHRGHAAKPTEYRGRVWSSKSKAIFARYVDLAGFHLVDDDAVRFHGFELALLLCPDCPDPVGPRPAFERPRIVMVDYLPCEPMDGPLGRFVEKAHRFYTRCRSQFLITGAMLAWGDPRVPGPSGGTLISPDGMKSQSKRFDGWASTSEARDAAQFRFDLKG